MKSISADNFGLVIAYLLPGFVTIWGLEPFVPTLASWMGTASATAPTIGEFFYATLGATAAGLLVSTIRWAVVDSLFHRTGIPAPDWDFSNLSANLAAFESHVQDHYRYYQFHANLLVAILIAYGFRLAAESRWPGQDAFVDLSVSIVVIVLFLGARDSLRKYYRRTAALLPKSKKHNHLNSHFQRNSL